MDDGLTTTMRDIWNPLLNERTKNEIGVDGM